MPSTSTPTPAPKPPEPAFFFFLRPPVVEQENSWSTWWYYVIALLSMIVLFIVIWGIDKARFDNNQEAFDGLIWYLVIQIVFAIAIYTSNRKNRFIVGYGNFTNSLLYYVSCFLAVGIVEIFNIISIIYSHFSNDKESETVGESGTGGESGFEKGINYVREKYSGFNLKMFQLENFDVKGVEGFQYLFGKMGYDKMSNKSPFIEGTDTIKTEVLLCTAILALGLGIPPLITLSLEQNLSEKWIDNVSPVSATISAAVLIFIYGTLIAVKKGDEVNKSEQGEDIKT